MEPAEDVTFWLLLLGTILITNIIFLNYIVSEASASYSKVNDNIDDYIQHQKAEMVAESQTVLPKKMMDAEWFPKYILIRKE